MSEVRGLIQVYTGGGKGKTTAALGLAMRARGHGLKVAIIQFLKGGSYYGELVSARKLGIEVLQYGEECPWADKMMKGELDCGSCRYCFGLFEEDQRRCQQALECAQDMTQNGAYDLVILDEINCALVNRMLKIEEVLKLLDHKHPKTEVVLTGRGAPLALLKKADLVTEMRMIQHPMRKQKMTGRRGVDY